MNLFLSSQERSQMGGKISREKGGEEVRKERNKTSMQKGYIVSIRVWGRLERGGSIESLFFSESHEQRGRVLREDQRTEPKNPEARANRRTSIRVGCGVIRPLGGRGGNKRQNSR